jgi:ParB-like chromosome segregation protein Spo0J
VPALQEAVMDGSSFAHIESEKRFGKQSRDHGKPPLQHAELAFLAITDLKPDPRNPRKHDRVQIRAIARSIEAFGFNAPILIDKHKQIIAGHGRLEAAKLNGYTYAPVICLEHLTEAQARAYMLADNKLTDRSSWDEAALAVHLKELSELALDFDIEAIGFELPEIDFRIQSLDITEDTDRADEFNAAVGSAVSRIGDLWLSAFCCHRVFSSSSNISHFVMGPSRY